jgi:hypothetical protein
MVRASKLALLIALGLLAGSVFAQEVQIKHERRPAFAADPGSPPVQKQPNYEYFSILDGTPMGLELHHDTLVGSNKPVDVYQFPIELQVLNSDGNFEPEGLIISNFFTAKPISPLTAPNPHNAHDCSTWNTLVLSAIKNQDPKAHVWSYIEFTVAMGARTIQTNEDGQVWWSDDIECWGSRDRFPPF